MHKKWMALCRRIIMLFVFTGPLGGLGLIACQKIGNHTKSHKTSYIIIAVDGLAFNDVNCYREARPTAKSGFDTLCQESVRYTHAYSTSNLTVPSLTSILTFQYPFQHGVRDNSMSLSAQVQTLPEIAYQNSIRTSFFSGGPSVLRRSGLQQGFEYFDENFSLNNKRLYRPAQQTLQEAQNWIKDVSKDSFLSVIYLADLTFKDAETTNDLGEIRSSSVESQLEEMDESLYHFFQFLIKSEQWNQTEVILIGLNGRQGDVTQPFDQKSVNLQIATLIKPAQKPRDQGINWSIDPYISTIDIGYTIAKDIDPNITVRKNPWSPIDLADSLKQAHLKFPHRWILSESAWPRWRQPKSDGGGIYFSFRQDPYLISATHRIRVYNTLLDKTESSSIPWQDVSEKAGMQEVQQFLKSFDWKPSTIRGEEILASLDRPVDVLTMEPCLDLVKQKTLTAWTANSCEDPFSLAFADWLRAEKSSGNNEWIRKKLIRTAYYSSIDRKISKANSQLKWIWDTTSSTMTELTPGEYILQLPEYTKERQWIAKEISTVKVPD